MVRHQRGSCSPSNAQPRDIRSGMAIYRLSFSFPCCLFWARYSPLLTAGVAAAVSDDSSPTHITRLSSGVCVGDTVDVSGRQTGLFHLFLLRVLARQMVVCVGGPLSVFFHPIMKGLLLSCYPRVCSNSKTKPPCPDDVLGLCRCECTRFL